PNDVLFINAGEHYEKGKRMNRLLPEHIDKIVDTYQFRKEEDRYSRRVSMEEIEDNGHNLNLGRYVSTAEPEPEIDLKAVHYELTEIKKEVLRVEDQHNEYLVELGLPRL
ncbi:MAG: N-6 DNA methylase, partial [Rhodobacteraceae bacterium]|nr:N-6 DNA methylase [Paracoccaceae bacterium]